MKLKDLETVIKLAEEREQILKKLEKLGVDTRLDKTEDYAGNSNTGNYNTGNYNTGNCNTGMFNKSDYNTGYFNAKNHTIKIFDCDSGLTIDDVYKTTWYRVLAGDGIQLTQWVYYTDEEKENSPIRTAAGGYLKKYTYEEACLNWWEKLSEEEKEIIKTIPNFSKDKFKEITGIEV